MATSDIHPYDPSLAHPFWDFQWHAVQGPDVALCGVLLFLSGVLCSAAGIGGGGVYVALLMVVGRLSPRNAVPLSKAVVFFGSVASLLVNLRRLWMPSISLRSSSAPIIDFDACRVVVPAALFGTFLGVLLNWHVADATIVVLLAMLLTIMTGLVLHTAWKQYLQETAATSVRPGLETGLGKAAPSQAGRFTAASSGSAGAGAGPGNDLGDDIFEDNEEAPLVPQATPALLKRRGSEALPLGVDVVLAAALMLIVVMSGILRFHFRACRAEQHGEGMAGSCRHPLMAAFFGRRLEAWMGDTATADILERLVTSLPLWSCLGLAVYFGRRAGRCGDWPIGRVVTYQLTAAATGVLAGLVGVGGGLILSPFFLLTGMEPAVAVATSSTCVLFTSSSTTIQYLFTDRIIMPLALLYGLVTLLASYSGTSLVHFVQDRFAGKQSHITLVVALGVGLSALLSVAKFVVLLRTPTTARA